MSASNWAICPRCLAFAKVERDERFETARSAYGVAAPEEYKRLLGEAQLPINPETFRTFREDYEFYGAEQGTVVAGYSGYCSVCSLSLDFKDAHPLYSA